MTPYYEDDLVTLYHGGCRGVTEWLAADVLVTDPPYGMDMTADRGSHRRRGRKGVAAAPIAGDGDTQTRDLALSAWGSERPALVFGRWSIARPAATRQILVWEKGNHTGMGDTNIPWRPSTEEVYVLGKWPPRPSLGRGGGGRVSPVLRFMATAALTGAAGRLHPTEKPTPLMEHLIQRCPIGVIADPFAGSGSTLVAAKLLGRKAIGVELEERYCEVAAKRLAQDTLFGGAAYEDEQTRIANGDDEPPALEAS